MNKKLKEKNTVNFHSENVGINKQYMTASSEMRKREVYTSHKMEQLQRTAR